MNIEPQVPSKVYMFRRPPPPSLTHILGCRDYIHVMDLATGHTAAVRSYTNIFTDRLHVCLSYERSGCVTDQIYRNIMWKGR